MFSFTRSCIPSERRTIGATSELVNDLGLEIKWHSQFKYPFITYLTTDYLGYISTLIRCWRVDMTLHL